MLNTKEMALLGIALSLAVALTASLILVTWTYDVKLVANPGGMDINAPVGKPFNISCRGLGGDESKFSSMKWLNPEEETIADGIPSIKREKNLLYLVFTNPKTEDSGMYRCTAVYDDEYNLQYMVNIRFRGPQPEFDLLFQNVTVQEHERAELYCFAEGERPMTYKWYNQSEDIISEDANRSIFARSTTNESTLIIQNAKRKDEGTYTCTASNNHGLTSKVFLLNVSPKDDNGTDFRAINVANVSASSVLFYIETTRPGRYIEVGYKEIRDSADYRRTFERNSSNLYNVTNLVPSGLYSFKFRLNQNEEIGLTDWSITYQVVLLPDVPEIIFHRMGSGNVKLEWFRTMENLMRRTVDKYEIKYYSVSMSGGNSWVASSCFVTIEIPSCFGSSYIISGLQEKIYYQIEVRAHSTSGYGEPIKQKIYLS